jgi:hypothetical protein
MSEHMAEGIHTPYAPDIVRAQPIRNPPLYVVKRLMCFGRILAYG